MLRKETKIIIPLLTGLLVAQSVTSWAELTQEQLASEKADLTDELKKVESNEEYEALVLNMSPEKRRDKAVKRIEVMRNTEGEVEALREEEKQKGQEIAKINCVNDQFMLIRGHINAGEQAFVAMDEAEKRNDPSSIKHHYTLISLSTMKVIELGEVSKLCVGKQSNATEQTQLTVSVSPEVVPVDPILPGGYTQIEDLFSEIYDVTGLTPLR